MPYNRNPDGFEQEIESLIGVRPDGWVYLPDSEGSDATVFFAWTPRADRAEGQPLSFESLQKLDREYGVVSVESESKGRTGSRLVVDLKEP